MKVRMPEDLAEALTLLAEGGRRVVPIAGGTDLMVQWPEREAEADEIFLDLSGLEDLRTIDWGPDELVIGGLSTYWDVMRDPRMPGEFPLLVEAARQVGAVQIQARGTWAGNIANASPAADGVPVLMAYGAAVVLDSRTGRSETELDRFYTGYKEMRMRADQLITSIRIPRRTYDVQVFEKVGPRRAQAITKVGVAVTHSDTGWRVVANSVAPTVRRCSQVEALLADEVPITSPADFLSAIRRDVSPIDDIRSTARYRESILARLLYFRLREHCRFIT